MAIFNCYVSSPEGTGFRWIGSIVLSLFCRCPLGLFDSELADPNFHEAVAVYKY